MKDAQELGEFLRSRRARLTPADVGLPPFGGRRRVPGLRREELAQLAGVSVDYYTRLEQGRSPSVSDEVLDAIARALGLDPTEHAHLRNLVRPARGTRPAARRQKVRPALQRLLDALDGVPAFVMGRRMDVLARNRLADALLPADIDNMARHIFLDPAAVDFHPDWERVAAETVAYLRLDAGRHPDDPKVAVLVGELSLRGDVFRRLWAGHDVREKTFGVKRMNHPVVGELTLSYETLALPGDPDQLLVAYTAEPGSPSAEALALLGSWAASAVPGTRP